MMSGMANLLKQYLDGKGLTFSGFARDLGVTDSAVWRWAHGERTPGLDEAYAIEKATGGEVPAVYWLNRKSGKAA